jgi:hypothetical protein
MANPAPHTRSSIPSERTKSSILYLTRNYSDPHSFAKCDNKGFLLWRTKVDASSRRRSKPAGDLLDGRYEPF